MIVSSHIHKLIRKLHIGIKDKRLPFHPPNEIVLVFSGNKIHMSTNPLAAKRS